MKVIIQTDFWKAFNFDQKLKSLKFKTFLIIYYHGIHIQKRCISNVLSEEFCFSVTLR